MNPLNPIQQVVSQDYHKFVMQDHQARVMQGQFTPPKPFDLKPPEKLDKAKKDLNKSKQQKNEEEEKTA
jgi:hypothetical protein